MVKLQPLFVCTENSPVSALSSKPVTRLGRMPTGKSYSGRTSHAEGSLSAEANGLVIQVMLNVQQMVKMTTANEPILFLLFIWVKKMDVVVYGGTLKVKILVCVYTC